MHTLCCNNLFTQAVPEVHRPMLKTQLVNVPQTLTSHDLGVSSCSTIILSL
ncbi:hypothetical protein E2C01_004837 [Portunus trituberculatus]|uniref:Uncharacterized protein n=1 Tax=Portunus trituberculatus TaxID=210409 RepID=A0A5B7CRL4_PORTR|nr:hypothetical protein [Portunus trituberculatus]